MCKYVERLNNGDVDQMKYKHYGKLHKHGKQTRDYWHDNIKRAIDLWNKSDVMKKYKAYRMIYDLSTSSMLVQRYAFQEYVHSKLNITPDGNRIIKLKGRA